MEDEFSAESQELDTPIEGDAAPVETPEGGATDTPDYSQPMFEAELDGEKLTLTGEDVLSHIARAKELERTNAELAKKAELAEMLGPLLKGREQQTQPQAPVIEPQPPGVNWNELGTQIVRMLEGEDGGPEAIGPALQNIISHAVREQTGMQQAVNSFKSEFSDFEEKMQSGAISRFLAQNPQYNPVEAFLVLKDRERRAEIENLRAQIEQAKQSGKLEGEKETVKNLRAKGAIRLLGGASGARGGANGASRYDLSDPDQRAEAMKAALRNIRSANI